MAGLAERIDVIQGAMGAIRILINGEEFPYGTIGGVHACVTRDGIPSITITIPAESLAIHADIEVKVSDGQ